MLIDFRVKNHLVFGNPAVLGMSRWEGGGQDHSGTGGRRRATPADRALATGFGGTPENGLPPHVVRCMALYGPSGAGKTSLVDSMECLREIVTRRRLGTPGDSIGDGEAACSHLKSCWHAPDELISFGVTFTAGDGSIFYYDIEFEHGLIRREILIAVPKPAAPGEEGEPEAVFDRRRRGSRDEFDWVLPSGKAVSKDAKTDGKPIRIELGQLTEMCRSDRAFLSMAHELNMGESIDAACMWLTRNLRPHADVPGTDDGLGAATWKWIKKDAGERTERVVRFLNQLGMHDVAGASWNPMGGTIFDFEDGKTRKRCTETYAADGLRTAFHWAGPILAALEGGHTLVLDGFLDRLHPCSVSAIIGMFHDREDNPKGAQLVFTSNNPVIADAVPLNGDQVCIIDRAAGASRERTIHSRAQFSDGMLGLFSEEYMLGVLGGTP